MRLGKRQLLAAMGVVCLGAATFVHAQQVLGGITGTVTDRAQAAISSAQLKITSISTGLSRTTAAQGNGSFTFPDLPSGTYSVSVSKEGFETQNYPAIVVQGNRVVTLQVQLAAGNITQSVTVEGSPLLNAVDTTNGYVLSHTQIQEIPLATGSFTQLAILSPGVNAELINGTGTNEGLGNQPIWANGQRDTDNTFQVNGVDVSNLFNGKSTSQVASGRVTPNTGENFTSGGTIQTNTSVYDAIGNAIPSPNPETILRLRTTATSSFAAGSAFTTTAESTSHTSPPARAAASAAPSASRRSRHSSFLHPRLSGLHCKPLRNHGTQSPRQSPGLLRVSAQSCSHRIGCTDLSLRQLRHPQQAAVQ